MATRKSAQAARHPARKPSPPGQDRNDTSAGHADNRLEDARVAASEKNLLRPLALLSADFRGRIRNGLVNRGHHLLPSQSAVLTHLAIDGSRPSELAARAGMSKQAMGKIVDELEQVGYVETAPDPADGRAKLIRFTGRGLTLLNDSAEIIDSIWQHYASLLSNRRLQQLNKELHILLHQLAEAETAKDSTGGDTP